ncbi:MAG: RNA 2',3'-cyclic phosphodiesterase [Pseudomonadota bacterium]
MIRAFVAIPMPDRVRDRLDDLAHELDEGRAPAWETFHLTLAFLGELSGGALEDVAWELDRLRAEAPQVALKGLGVFGGARPRSAHAVARPEPRLSALREAVRRAARAGGLELPRERFTPHVTVARFSARAPAGAGLARWLEREKAFETAPFAPREAVLYRSWRGAQGAAHEPLMDVPLSAEIAPSG